MRFLNLILCFMLSIVMSAGMANTTDSSYLKYDNSFFEEEIGEKIKYDFKRQKVTEKCFNFSGRWTLVNDLSLDSTKFKPEYLEIDQIGCEFIFIKDQRGFILGSFKMGHHLVTLPPVVPNPYRSMVNHMAARWNNESEIDGSKRSLHVPAWLEKWNWILSVNSADSELINIKTKIETLNYDLEKQKVEFLGTFKRLAD